MKIKTLNARSLGECMDYIRDIAEAFTSDKDMKPPVLWFRGHERTTYFLCPSLYRDLNRDGLTVTGIDGGNKEYTKLHYADDVRTQHYMAKNSHLLKEKPASKIEWLEVMQHHEAKTRLLDWSESAVHALVFALECFFDGRKIGDDRRQKATPCIWVLNPQELNKKIFKKIACRMTEGNPLFESIKKDFRNVADEKLQKVYEEYAETADYAETKGTKQIDYNYIVNLSKITEELMQEVENTRRFLRTGHGVNPYYYALSRIYADGVLLKNRELPPLAIVNSYHSERIKAQRGVFTVFPHYMDGEKDSKLREMEIKPEAMEHMSDMQDCLYKINLLSPQKIAYELMACGINVSWLYPEMPIITNEIENRGIV